MILNMISKLYVISNIIAKIYILDSFN